MKNKFLTLLIASICTMLLLSNCKKDDEQPLPKIELKKTSWTFKGFDLNDGWKDAVDDSPFYITFKEDGTIEGESGCNGFVGTYKLNNSVIKIEMSNTTLLLCEDELAIQEELFVDYLNKATEVKQSDTQLEIICSLGGSVVFKPKNIE